MKILLDDSGFYTYYKRRSKVYIFFLVTFGENKWAQREPAFI